MTHGATYTLTHPPQGSAQKRTFPHYSSSSKTEWECGAVTMVLLAASLEHHTAFPHSNTGPNGTANHTHITMTLPKTVPCRCKLGLHEMLWSSLRMKLLTHRVDGAAGNYVQELRLRLQHFSVSFKAQRVQK